MRGVSRIILLVTILGGLALAAAPQAHAGIFFRRVAPVRRVAARAVLPPYRVARAVLPPYPVARAVLPPYGVRRVAYGPVYRPYGYWARPVVYGPGVVVGVGW